MKRAVKSFFDLSYLNMMRFMREPEHFLNELLTEWGDPFPLAFPKFPVVWLTQEALEVKKIFTAPAGTFIPSRHNPVAPLLGNNGLIMLGGDEHAKTRKDLGPNFMGEQLKQSGKLITDAFYEICQEQKIENGEFVLQNFSQAIALRIILRLIFPHIDQEQMREVEKRTKDFLTSYSPTLLFIPKWLSARWSNFQKKKQQLDNIFFQCYLTGLYQGVEGPIKTLTERNPSKEQVLDQLRTMVVAGHETTATSLVWTLFLLHQQSEENCKKMLLAELDTFPIEETIEFAGNLSYLDAVVNESLRLHPPVPFITRKVVVPFEMGGVNYKPGEELGVSITLLHRSPAIWKDPMHFIPERFIQKKYTPFEFAPFGGGNRKCIGAALAMSELKILTALFMKEFDAVLCSSGTMKPKVMQITIGPKDAIVFQVKKRANVDEAKLENFFEHSAPVYTPALEIPPAW